MLKKMFISICLLLSCIRESSFWPCCLGSYIAVLLFTMVWYIALGLRIEILLSELLQFSIISAGEFSLGVSLGSAFITIGEFTFSCSTLFSCDSMVVDESSEKFGLGRGELIGVEALDAWGDLGLSWGLASGMITCGRSLFISLRPIFISSSTTSLKLSSESLPKDMSRAGSE